MRIQHNIPAMNSLTNYTRNNNALAGNLEKLSSGYRINSAADDAAGLAISEKMRSQIKGLEQAYNNANDGISLVQTAEGALTEVNSMLTRLTELATQSANGTYQDDVDREAIQEETDAILDEIDRISKATNYNGINLLDGSLGSASSVKNLSISSADAVAGVFTAGSATAAGADDMTTKLTAADIGKSLNYTVNWVNEAGESKATTVKFTFKGDGKDPATLDTNTKNNNYFEYGNGKKLSLGADGKISQADFEAAIKDALAADSEFSASFSVDIPAADHKAQFTAKTAGENGAKVVGIDVKSVDGMTAAAVTSLTTSAGASALVTETTAGKNAMQYFDPTKLMTIQDGDNKETIESKMFEVDGHKFAIIQNDLDKATIDAIAKALGPDVNMIEIKGAGANPVAADDGAEIAAQIAKVTGREVDFFAAATGKVPANMVAFTNGDLKLGGGNGGLTLQVGDTNDSFQKVSVAIEDMSSTGLGLTGLDLSDQDTAGDAIKTIKDAVNKVSAQRGRLGALQNRLDHTLNNLDATTENITSAESQIRDVNMAKEMTAYTKNNILAQAAQSMLAQANSMPQGVLQLLQ